MRTPLLLRAVYALSVPVVFGSLVAATPAYADPPLAPLAFPIDGYVWASQPANPSYLATTGYEHNSSGGGIRVTRSATGVYQARFYGMAGAGGVAHVGAYGNNDICTVSSWGQSGADEVVNVRCFTPAGAAADSRFIAHVTNRTDGAARGYLWSNDSTPPVGGYVPSTQYSFDSTGQGITIFGEGTGSYAVDLNAFGQDAPDTWTTGSLRVTAYGTAAVTCQVFDPDLFGDPEVLRVRCYDTTGSLVNSRFALSYTRGVVPLSATTDNYAIVPVVAGSTGPAPTVTAIDDDGDYQIEFPGAGTPNGHAYAFGMAAPPQYCNIHSWTISAGAQRLRVRCYQVGSGDLNPMMLVNVGFFT
jgi:hypothetical protein